MLFLHYMQSNVCSIINSTTTLYCISLYWVNSNHCYEETGTQPQTNCVIALQKFEILKRSLQICNVLYSTCMVVYIYIKSTIRLLYTICYLYVDKLKTCFQCSYIFHLYISTKITHFMFGLYKSNKRILALWKSAYQH